MNVILCVGDATACWCCDHRDPEPIRTAEGRVYCSIECHDDWEEHLAQLDRQRSEEWCPSCGYDRFEHSDSCPDYLAHLRERQEKPWLYGV